MKELSEGFKLLENKNNAVILKSEKTRKVHKDEWESEQFTGEINRILPGAAARTPTFFFYHGANTKEDIKEIQSQVDLPVIGIVKRDYEGSKVYITPTMKEIDELMEVGPEIIAVDATSDLRPGNITIDQFFGQIKEKYPDQLLMADCSTIEEAIHADELGFDFIGTTMVGYTD